MHGVTSQSGCACGVRRGHSQGCGGVLSVGKWHGGAKILVLEGSPFFAHTVTPGPNSS
jgi:hypothetical protein